MNKRTKLLKTEARRHDMIGLHMPKKNSKEKGTILLV